MDSPADDEPNTAMTNVAAAAAAAGDLEMEIDASLGRLDGVGESEDAAPTGAPPPMKGGARKTGARDVRDAVDTASMHREPMHTIESDAISSAQGGPHTLPGMGDNAGTIPPEEPSREELDLDDVDLVEQASGDPMESTQARPQTEGEEEAASADTPFEGNPHRRPDDDDEHTETGQTVRPLR
jgi:hypothetical protein